MERTTTLAPPPLDVPPRPGSRRPSRRARAPWWRLRVPWTLYRYIMGDLLRVTILGVLAVSLLYTTLAAYQTVRSGLQLSFVWPLLLKTLAYPLYFSLPVAFLFAITLVIGRMVGDLEVTALNTHGISYRQVYLPVFLLGIALGGVSFYLNGWVVPDIHYAKRNLQTYILDQLENLGSGINRTILLPRDEGALWVERYKGTDLAGVRIDFKASKDSMVLPAIRQHLPNQIPNSVRIFANRGHIEILPDRRSVLLSLRSVQILVPEQVKNATVANEVFHQKVAITENVVIPLSFAPKTPGTKDLTNPELLEHIASLKAEALPQPLEGEAGLAHASFRTPEQTERLLSRIDDASTELHRRLAFTLSCLTFPLIGVSLSLLLDRWGRLVPFFAGNLLVIALYYPLVMFGVLLGESGVWPVVSMSLPNLVLLSIGIYLSRKVVER